MSNQIYDWEQILQDSADIMATSIINGETISKISELYAKLEIKYKAEKKMLPSDNTYRQVFHKKLNIAPNQTIVTSTLYQLAGKYDKMTLDMLAENVRVSSQTKSDSSWLFIRLKNIVNDVYADITKHLYHLSHKLKENFHQEIIYISFDTDTLIILCADSDSRDKLVSYFNKFGEKTGETE